MIRFALIFIVSFLWSLNISAQKKDVYKELIKSNIDSILEKTKLTSAELNSAEIINAYTDSHNGVSHIYLQQTVDNIPVYKTQLQLHFNKQSELFLAHNQFIPNSNKLNVNKIQSLDEKIAIKKAAEQVLFIDDPQQAQIKFKKAKNQNRVYTAPLFAKNEIEVEKIYFFNEKNKTFELSFKLDIDDKNSPDWWELAVNGETGEVLYKENYTYYCSFHNKYETNKPKLNSNQTAAPAINCTANSYNVFPYPVESPSHGNRDIVIEPWLDAINASPLGWHNDDSLDYIYLRGNNVYATEDTLNTDTLGFSPENIDLCFDFDFDVNAEPVQNIETSITNIFYWSNLMHDVWYQYGFDEVSGNFQNSNFGKGGEEGDFVYADALDGDGFNNANFSTPPDGKLGRMQMFEWIGSATEHLEITAPSQLVGTYITGEANFGEELPLPLNPIIGEFAIAIDSTSTPNEVCDSIINANEIIGKIAMIDRGNCFFTDKIMRAQQAGAIACVICNNVDGNPIGMSGTNDSITIPALMMRKIDCDSIKIAIENGETVTAQISDSGDPLNYDSGFDNGIICHEYGHGISTRLTGGPGVNCLSSAEQMGEGWSDWIGLMMTIEPGDTGPDRRGIGIYVKGEDIDGKGIRLAPYSTSFDENDYTYGDLCGTPVPHGVGFVWGTMLWDLTWSFIDVYGFDPDLYNGSGGNNMMMQLVLDAMKLQPCSPGFVDARDAILAADMINNNGTHQKMIWEAFARRGLGFSADQGSSNNICDGIEAFDLPLEFQEVLKVEKIVNLDSALPGDTLIYSIIVKNDDSQTQYNISVIDSIDLFLNVINVNDANAVLNSDNVLSLIIDSLQTGNADTLLVEAVIDENINTILGIFDDVETLNFNWFFPDDSLSNNTFLRDTTKSKSGDFSWFAENIDTQSNQIMAIPIRNIEGKSFLSFWHYYNTETVWDGGVVEISTDNQISWTDLGPYFIQNGYNETIQVNQASAISGQDAFTGKSLDFIQSIVDLTSFAGNDEIYIRFRFASDAYVGGEGWYIDDINVFSGDLIFNRALIASDSYTAFESNIVSTTITPYLDGKIRIKVFLEAYYDTTSQLMTTKLFDLGIAPDMQPFNIDPYNYYGSESIDTSLSWTKDISDWVLVQLRAKQDSTLVVEQKAALLRSDGYILDENGEEGVHFLSTQSGDSYFISIIHKSHLPILSKNAIYNSQILDFSSDSSLIANSFILQINNDTYAAYAGDIDHNGIVNSQDINIWFQSNSLVGAYVSWDIDGNGLVNVVDYNWWNKNRAKIGSIRY